MSDNLIISNICENDYFDMSELPPYLDVTSPKFDALRALYADPRIDLFKNLKRFSLHNRSFQKTKPGIDKKIFEKPLADPKYSTKGRRFVPHKITTKSTDLRKKNIRHLYRLVEKVEGPLAFLRDCILNNRRVILQTRLEDGVQGKISGTLISFDKHWNLLLKDVHEISKGKKLKFNQINFFGPLWDCTELNFGMTSPVEVRISDENDVELSRRVPHLLVRGEHIITTTTENN